MYLSKLEILGFKSFANKSIFDFSDGISALVGPNGCGKTNVVDAVRWVLGEQKSTILRSDVMGNVIFNGTANRKPLGMAEVSITLENNKKILPIEYDEVMVTRRLFRDGDSQYLLNKVKCRLRDILDLFMDTGMGPDSYSVIELKMVEAILSGKVDERRHLFEEAAGVNKYKYRRKEAESRLQSVQTDLVRLQDILDEVQKNVNSLARQAAKTRRYNKLQFELHDTELNLIKHEYYFIKIERDKLLSDINKLKENRNNIEEEVLKSETNLTEIIHKRQSLDKDFQNTVKEESAIQAAVDDKKQQIAVSHEKLQNLKNSIVRLQTELKYAENSYKEHLENTSELESRLVEITDKKEISENEFSNNKILRDDALRAVKNNRELTNSANEEVINIQNNLSSIKNEKKRNSERIIFLQKKIEESKEEIKQIDEQLIELNDNFQDLLKQRDNIDEKLKDAENILYTSQETKNAYRSALDELKQQITERKNQISQKTSTKDFLLSLIDSSITSKFLLEPENWKTSGEKILLAESIGADDKFLIAIDSALGEAGHYFIVENRGEAISAINALEENNKGKTAFICKENIPVVPPPGNKIDIKGSFGYLSEIVRCDENIRYALRGILGGMIIVDDLDHALELLNSFPTLDSAVTLKGEIVRNSGILYGGAKVNQDTITVGKKERIEILENDIKKLKNEISKLEKSLYETQEQFDSIDIRQLNEELKAAQNAKTNYEGNISQIIYRRELLDNNIANLENICSSYTLEIEKIESENINFDNDVLALDEKLITAKEELQNIQNEFQNVEEYYEECEKNLNQTQMSNVRLKAELSSVEKEIANLKKQIQQVEMIIQTKQADIISSESSIAKTTENIDNFNNELIEIETQEKEAKTKHEYLSNQINVIQTQIEQYSIELKNQRKSVERELEIIHERDIKLSEYKSQISNLRNRASQEQYSVDLDEMEFEPTAEFSIDNHRYLVKELNTKLQTLGPINHRALVDFEKESEKLIFLNKQVKDLVESEKNLQDTIIEINDTAKKMFQDTFENIHKNFKTLFKTLFGSEGEAELQISGDNALEANIEIIAKPPGKRPHSIEGISSGEKTLTAIALLFAIYMVKPSPFCILDEVDAPLDDTNIGKFLELIRKFSQETQFLIVTHNKTTMEAADTLYGITMEEDGVSKIVSVKLEQNN